MAELQYKKKVSNKNPAWNFGPNRKSFVKVSDILKIIQKKSTIKFEIKRNKNFFETNILKLSNTKAKKILNWYPIWDLQKSIDSVMEWNNQIKKGKDPKKICENQINDYLK